jgi:hypothetical protein
MAAPESNDRASIWPLLLAAGAVAACCGLPALLALAATGAGVAAARFGLTLAGVAVAAGLVIAGLVWWRRRGCACAADAALPSAGDQRGPVDRSAPEREEASRVR